MQPNSLATSKLVIEVDEKSGFCFGVSRAVKLAEEHLKNDSGLVSLGDIVHNDAEINRLANLGMGIINKGNLDTIDSKTVLFRAHGEPPSSYELMKEAGKKVVDATCPVVLHLQKRIRDTWSKVKGQHSQIVIFGKKGHAEVIGLVGQTKGEAIVVQGVEDLELVARDKETYLFSQTTMSLEGLQEIEKHLTAHLTPGTFLKVNKSICAQVENRVPHLREFAANFDVIFFVAGANSSNGKGLYKICRDVNPRTYYVSATDEILPGMLHPMPSRIGVCGATSTPRWLMDEVAQRLRQLANC